MKPSSDIARLIEIMAALRTPGTGCPWDLEQDFATIAPYTIEEAYEVADAIGPVVLGVFITHQGDEITIRGLGSLPFRSQPGRVGGAGGMESGFLRVVSCGIEIIAISLGQGVML